MITNYKGRVVDNFQDDHLIIQGNRIVGCAYRKSKEVRAREKYCSPQANDVLNYIVEVRNNRIAMAGDSPESPAGSRSGKYDTPKEREGRKASANHKKTKSIKVRKSLGF